MVLFVNAICYLKLLVLIKLSSFYFAIVSFGLRYTNRMFVNVGCYSTFFHFLQSLKPWLAKKSILWRNLYLADNEC